MEYDYVKFNKSCENLELNSPFSETDLRKQYRMLALKYHPDKFPEDKNGEKFKTIHSSYLYLNKHLTKAECLNSEPESYNVLLKEFLEYLNISFNIPLVINIIDTLNNNYDMLAKNLFRGLPKDTCIELFHILNKYRDILNINVNFFIELEEIVREKSENDNLLIVYPSMDDLFESNISCLEFKGDTYYVPLWHSEVTYEIGDGNLMVKCIPNCPDYIKIDEANNVHVYLRIFNFHTLIELDHVSFLIGSRRFFIKTNELRIVKTQTIKKLNEGIPVINTREIYCNKTLSNICIHIEFIEDTNNKSCPI